jgi:hypothetical protein
MNAALFRRGRAERFDQLLDEASGGRRHHVRSQADDELKELLSVTKRVSDLPLRVDAQPEFREGLRAMLMATIEREGIGATATNAEPETPTRRLFRRPVINRPAYSRRSRTRGAIVIGLAAGTLAVSGISAASGDAIPGDALYGMKRSTEKAQLALAGSDISRGQLYLGFAKTRLAEAHSVRGDRVALSASLDDMDNETRLGVKLLTGTAVDRRDKAALDVVDAFAIEQRRALTQLRDSVRGEAAPRVGQSIALLEEVLRRSTALRPLVGCGTAATAGLDTLGPKPREQFNCRQPYGQRPNSPAGTSPPQQQQQQQDERQLPAGTPSVEATTPSTTSTPAEPEPSSTGEADESGGILGDLLEGLGG